MHVSCMCWIYVLDKRILCTFRIYSVPVCYAMSALWLCILMQQSCDKYPDCIIITSKKKKKKHKCFKARKRKDLLTILKIHDLAFSSFPSALMEVE